MDRTNLELMQQAVCRQQWEMTKGNLRATLSLSGSGHTPDGEISKYDCMKELVDDLIQKVEEDELFYF